MGDPTIKSSVKLTVNTSGDLITSIQVTDSDGKPLADDLLPGVLAIQDSQSGSTLASRSIVSVGALLVNIPATSKNLVVNFTAADGTSTTVNIPASNTDLSVNIGVPATL